MSQGYSIIEVTKDNKNGYIRKIAELETLVLDGMEKEGKRGQLFTTGEEGITEYADSCTNHVFIALEEENAKSVVSAAYITKDQTSGTYDDLTKYFRYGQEYQEYIKSKYPDDNEYLNILKEIYIKKILAFCYARDKILADNGIQRNR